MFFQAPKRTGISRQGTPVRNFQITASTKSRLPMTIAPNTSGAALQQFRNPRELIAAQSMTVHREAFQRRLPMNHAFPDLRIRSAEKYSSRFSNVQYRFRLIEDTP